LFAFGLLLFPIIFPRADKNKSLPSIVLIASFISNDPASTSRDSCSNNGLNSDNEFLIAVVK